MPDLFGKARSEFEKSRFLAKKEIEELKNQSGSLTNCTERKVESIADTLGIDYYGKTDDEVRVAINAELNRTTKSKKCIDWL